LARRWVALAAVVLLGGCSTGLEAGVNVKSVATDLVYGIPEQTVPAAPANIGTPPDEPIGVVVRGNDDDDDVDLPPAPPRPACPPAPLNKFPDPALSTVKGRPAEGDYKWIVKGTEDTATLGKIALPRQSQKTITGVSTTEGQNFQFIVEEEDYRFGARTKISTRYEVRHDDGIFITRIEREQGGGGQSTFTPSPAVEIMPLPAAIGAEINGTGIDPTTLEVLRVTGTVPKRHRIDACGDPIDTFFGDAVQEFISAQGAPTRRNYDFGVATALGGQIVFEHVEAPCESGGDESGKCAPDPTLVFDAHIGQIKPDEPE
jgi:hypothetical protein